MALTGRMIYVSGDIDSLEDMRSLIGAWEDLAHASGFTAEPELEWLSSNEIALSGNIITEKKGGKK